MRITTLNMRRSYLATKFAEDRYPGNVIPSEAGVSFGQVCLVVPQS